MVHLRDIVKEEFTELGDVKLIEETPRQKLRKSQTRFQSFGPGKWGDGNTINKIEECFGLVKIVNVMTSKTLY